METSPESSSGNPSEGSTPKSVKHGEYQYASAMHTPSPLNRDTLNKVLFEAAVAKFSASYCVKEGVLAINSSEFHDVPFRLREGNLGEYFVATPECMAPSENFVEMTTRRKTWTNVTNNGVCPSVGTSYVMICDIYDGEMPVGKYMALTTKKDGAWGAAISGYNNLADYAEIDKNGCIDARGSVFKTMRKEVDEEAILITPEGKWCHWHFPEQDENSVKIFGKTYDYSDGKIEVEKTELPKWLPCSDCMINGNKISIFLDPHNNNGQFVDCGTVRINLKDKLSFIHSESAAVSKEVDGKAITEIEERLNPNGIILMELDKNGNPTGEFKKLVMGTLVDTERPTELSELFSVKKQDLVFNGSPYSIPTAVAEKKTVIAEDFLDRF